MTTLDIPTAEVFEPLLQPSRYKGAHGGRGSGKSHFFGGLVTEEHATIPGHRTVCIREVQKSIKLSSKQLIVDKINQFNLNHLFDIQDQQIKTPKDGVIVFQGLQNHTAESIKSLEGFDRAWVEEAQSISKYSWDMLRPTFRKPGSEIWASWNPLMEEDAIDKFFRGEGSDRSDMKTVQANWSDNPWFKSGTLPEERIEDLRARPDDYDWIWEGAYRTVSEAAIFRNKFEITEFDTPEDAIFFHGADWGYANDPTTLVRMFIQNECLYIDAECYSTGIELDDLPRFFDAIPTARKWPIRADAAAPQIISYVRRQGFNIAAAKKWPKSVEEGIAYLRGFKKIYIHRRCVNTAKEFRSYSWKTDRHSGVLVPVPEDANNHAIDAIRYALDAYITTKGMPVFKKTDLSRI